VEKMIVTLARGLVEHPERVEVEREEDEGTVHLALVVDPEDLGQVIGRGGRNARALRILLRAASRAQGTRASLEIVDD
jgi:predicted RNA-binding protein YlqC (UPF0109 family)